MISTVYFLQVQPFGPIKIGFTSKHVNLRMRALQASSPHELKWIGYFLGSHADEQAAHKRLAQYRIRAEWFHPAPEVLAFVSEKCPAFDEAAYLRDVFHDQHRAVVRSLSTDVRARIASAIGIQYSDMVEWICSLRMLDGETAAKAGELAHKHIALTSDVGASA